MDVVETDGYPLIDDYLGSGVELVEGSFGVRSPETVHQLLGIHHLCPAVCFRPDF